MLVVVKGKISRNAGHHYAGVRVQRVEGVTADSTAWTADTICVTADGKIICIPAAVAEVAVALDTLDSLVVAGGAVIPADVLEPADALDEADAVSVTEAAVIEAADALDTSDAISIVSANVLEAAIALDALDVVADVAAAVAEVADALDVADAAIGAQVLFGTVDEPADALDQLDATVDAAAVSAPGGGYYYRPQRPFPVEGVGLGILPRLEGAAHGVVVVVGTSAGTLPSLVGEATGLAGVAGRSAAALVVRAMATGVGGTRGAGAGLIVKFNGSATGQHDDDEAAVIAFLLAA